MLISSLLFIPIIGVLVLYIRTYLPLYRLDAYRLDRNIMVRDDEYAYIEHSDGHLYHNEEDIKSIDEYGNYSNQKNIYKKDRKIALAISIMNLIISLIVYISYDSSSILFQFVQDNYDTSFFNIYLGVDGISIYFVLLTTTIMPLAILSNWRSITANVRSYLIILLLLETLLIAVFLVLDVLLFYIFFESILPPAWISGKYSWWDKLSNSGDTLKLKVPSYSLKTISGWSNYSGMVTSLMMRENKMGNRGSKSVLAKINTVKEQRVYDSCIGTLVNSPMLRCTLKGFERNYQVRIPSNHLNSLRQYSTVITRVAANSQIGGYLLKPYFVTGFTDAEGSFIVRIRQNPKAKAGWNVETKFSFCIHKKDRMILDLIQAFFGGVGSITYASKDTLHYRIASLHDLINVVIPHFDKYPLNTQKRADYFLFKEIVLLIKNKQHLTIEGIQKIVNLRASINLGGSESLKEAFPNTVPVERPVIEDIAIDDPYWFAGFASGEACFSVNIYKSKTKLGEAVQLKFDLAQYSRDSKLLISLQNL